MGRPATGSLKWNAERARWEVRVTLASGKRSKPIAMTGLGPCTVTPNAPAKECPCEACSVARAKAAETSDFVRVNGVVPLGTGETSSEWYRDKYLPLFSKLGNRKQGHVGAWDRYVAPFAGTKPLNAWTTDDVKAIRDNLAKLRREGKIGAKWAFNIWSSQIKAPLSRAFSDDDPDYSSIRVGSFAANPATGIKPPVSLSDRDEDERARQALEAGAFLALVSCEALSLDFRRTCAIKAYTGLRPAEIYGLRWPDVRLDDRRPVIKVQRARDMKTGIVGDTKTKDAKRDVPIHPELRPLLRLMRDEAADRNGLVFPIPDARVREVEELPAVTRAALERAGVNAPELVHGSETVVPFDDRSWRTTFATWCARAGYDSQWVDAWLGHRPKTTAAKHYVRSTPHFEDVLLKAPAPGMVPPFPPLPKGLLVSDRVLAFRSRDPVFSGAKQCEGRDLNPYRSYPTGT